MAYSTFLLGNELRAYGVDGALLWRVRRSLPLEEIPCRWLRQEATLYLEPEQRRLVDTHLALTKALAGVQLAAGIGEAAGVELGVDPVEEPRALADERGPVPDEAGPGPLGRGPGRRPGG